MIFQFANWSCFAPFQIPHVLCVWYQRRVHGEFKMEQSRTSSQIKKSLILDNDAETEEVNNMIDTLKEHIKNCQKLGKYVEAKMAQNRIEELKEKLQEMKYAKIYEYQEQKINSLNEAYEQERNSIEEKWAGKLEEKESSAEEERQKLVERQENELQESRTQIENKIPDIMHISQELVALKKMEDALGKQGKFEEAHNIQMEYLRKEKIEQEKWAEDREVKIMKKLQVISLRQANEQSALESSLEERRQLSEKEMKIELDQCEKRYKKSRTQIDSDVAKMLKQLDIEGKKGGRKPTGVTKKSIHA
eukprot:TRINITY_DN44029_c0_g1_i1.p2 TRINITY_DN44029_c0_g1~~TRINITY_DN44029_c0_g1_i1.p2  ORF type:complete len:305 (-),score=81.26 TRINITY_DN44029_c0_g1_i1:74-988(-)